MSRAGYCDDLDDPLEHGRWRAQVRSATRGKRGQKLLRDLLDALDAMPEKRLVKDVLEVSAEADEKHAQSWVKMFGDAASADRYREHHVKPRTVEYREGDVRSSSGSSWIASASGPLIVVAFQMLVRVSRNCVMSRRNPGWY